MGLISGAQFLSKQDLPYEDVPCPEFGNGSLIRVRTMRGDEKEQWEIAEESRRKDKPEAERLRGFRALLIAFCACDDRGDPLFTLADVPQIAQADHRVLSRLGEAALRLNALVDAEGREKN